MKIALLIIYNHRYDKNIPRLQKMYDNRFDNIYHIVPFYDGNIKNVIPVFESSFQFQGYIAQAYQHIKQQNFTHYLIIADDLILNPQINKNNILEKFEINSDECWLPHQLILQTRKGGWAHLFNAMQFDPKAITGAEISNIIPTKEEATSIFNKKNIPTTKIPLKVFLGFLKNDLRIALKNIDKILFNRKLKYPLVAGYSDILVVTNNVMPKFAQYCGVFAATRLFVEIAIPTAMVLAAEKIAYWKCNDVFYNIKNKGLEKLNYSLQKLQENFPNILYLHPIKLSKWK